MAEENKTKNVEDLLAQIDEFEKTIQSLSNNVATLREKLVKNKEKYGSDISQWPKEEQEGNELPK